MKKKVLFLILVIFIPTGIALASSPGDYYQKNPFMAHHMEKATPACLTRDLLTQFLMATYTKDNASTRYLLDHGCILFRPDIPVTVMDVGAESGPLTIVKVRGYVNDNQDAITVWTFRLGLRK